MGGERRADWAGIGCALFVMGLIGAAFGITALTVLPEVVELEFFEIALNDTRGRVGWTVGCLALAGAGWWLMQRYRRDR